MNAHLATPQSYTRTQAWNTGFIRSQNDYKEKGTWLPVEEVNPFPLHSDSYQEFNTGYFHFMELDA